MQEILSILKLLATSNTINFIIMLIILGWIIKKFDISSVMAKGINNVAAEIKKSEGAKDLSKKHLEKSKELLENLPNDIKELETNSAHKVEIFKAKISETTQKTIQNLEQNSLKSIEIEEKKISNLLKEEVTKNSIVQAKSNIINLLKSNPELHNEFILDSIEQLDKVKL